MPLPHGRHSVTRYLTESFRVIPPLYPSLPLPPSLSLSRYLSLSFAVGLPFAGLGLFGKRGEIAVTVCDTNFSFKLATR